MANNDRKTPWASVAAAWWNQRDGEVYLTVSFEQETGLENIKLFLREDKYGSVKVKLTDKQGQELEQVPHERRAPDMQFRVPEDKFDSYTVKKDWDNQELETDDIPF